MAKLLGRLKPACPCCGHNAVHIKQNEGKLPFLHCPECGFLAATKSGKQAAGLMANMRPEQHAPTPPMAPRPPATDQPIMAAGLAVPPAPAPMDKPMDKPADKPAGLWDALMHRGRATP